MRTQMRESIEKLTEVKESICKSLMTLDLFRRNFVSKIMSKPQCELLLKDLSNLNLKIKSEQVFGFEKHLVEFEQVLKVENPIVYSKALLSSKSQLKGAKSSNLIAASVPEAFYKTYYMTLLKSA